MTNTTASINDIAPPDGRFHDMAYYRSYHRSHQVWHNGPGLVYRAYLKYL